MYLFLCLQGIQQDEQIRKTQKESKAGYLLCSLHYEFQILASKTLKRELLSWFRRLFFYHFFFVWFVSKFSLLLFLFWDFWIDAVIFCFFCCGGYMERSCKRGRWIFLKSCGGWVIDFESLRAGNCTNYIPSCYELYRRIIMYWWNVVKLISKFWSFKVIPFFSRLWYSEWAWKKLIDSMKRRIPWEKSDYTDEMLFTWQNMHRLNFLRLYFDLPNCFLTGLPLLKICGLLQTFPSLAAHTRYPLLRMSLILVVLRYVFFYPSFSVWLPSSFIKICGGLLGVKLFFFVNKLGADSGSAVSFA